LGDDDLGRLAIELGSAIRRERERRRMTIRQLAQGAGVGISTLYAAETGRTSELGTYVRIARALRLRLEMGLTDPRRRNSGAASQEDPTHAAMGEIFAARFASLGLRVGLDEPYQHYKFAGRADVLAWSAENRTLLHIENRTRFPNLQEAFGSFNSKRAYLGDELAKRFGLPGWRSETHVLVALWSAEVLHAIRLHRSSFAAICPGSIEAFESWWSGVPATARPQPSLIVFDPIDSPRRDRWIGMSAFGRAKPRYRDYAEALAAIRSGRS
jgi:transcriptional regulator with XRE-family HTH domain